MTASTFGDLFETVSKIRLDTLPECPISSITDLDIDSNGNFVVADGWRIGRVYCFTPDGRFVRTIGKHGQGPGEYATPVSVAAERHGGIVVCDYLQNQIIYFDEDYRHLKSIRGNPRFQYFVHINSLGEIFTYSGAMGPRIVSNFNTIHKHDDSGNEISSFAPIQGEVSKSGFSAVFDGMTIDNEGFIYEKNPLFYQIRKFSSMGAQITIFSRPDKVNKIENYSAGEVSNGPFILDSGLLIIQRGGSLDLFDGQGRFLKGDLPLHHRILLAKGNAVILEERQEDDGSNIEQENPTLLKVILRRSENIKN